MSVLIVGSVALDTIEAGGRKVKEALGGSAVYASVASSFLTKTAVISVVGKDFPKKHIDVLKKHKIDISELKISEGRTFRWTGKYSCDFNQAHTLDTQLNVFERFKPIVCEKNKNIDYLLLANIDPDIQFEVLKNICNVKIVALDTMNLWITTKLKKLKKLLKLVDILFINEDEAKQLSNSKNLLLSVKAISKMGPKIIIIKRGEFGAMLFKTNELFFVPSYPLEKITDTTGAGDTFAGAFVSYISYIKNIEIKTLKNAMFYATVMASFNIESFSVSKLSNLTKKEISSRLKMLKKITEL
ncbi:MAG: PfkB family carbohydrate kinase [Endomicrobiaceae bacterium]|nr:PfkB family carbohydrate kinase [Endomicrobiaceae bacterium]